MRRLLVFLTGFIFVCVESLAQIKQKIATPVYLSILLIDQPNVDKMTEAYEYYNLIEKPDKNGYKVFRHTDGTEFRFKTTNNNNHYYPVVKVTTKETQMSIDEVLSNAGYVKQSGSYVRGSKFEHCHTRCNISGGSKKTLTFTKEYNSL